MNFIIPVIILLFGLGVGYFIGSSRLRSNNKAETFINDAERIKSENMAKLKEYIANIEVTPLDSSASNGARINNEDVRELLNVSDTTACRYLNDLEKEGLVKQIGTDGPKVYYNKV